MDYYHVHNGTSCEPCDIIQTTYGRAEILNPILENKIRNIGDVINRASNVQADMTDFNMHSDSDFKKICDFAIMQVINSIEGLNTRGADMLRFDIIDCWGMIYKSNQGHYTREHAHWPSTFSFCYYVNACEECAPLKFTKANYEVNPFSGLMVIFPGNVSHSVPNQYCTHDRVAISGNISVTVKKPGEVQ